jgi:hypothetical protein
MLKSKLVALQIAFGCSALAAAPTMAADLGGNCCADLEERIAELEATTARKGNRKVSLTISGWVNEQVVIWDDGREKNAYQTTTENERTRFRFVGNAKIDASWSAGYLLEIGVRGSNQAAVSQVADDAGQGLDVRRSQWFIQNKDLGKIWVGQGSQATDGITEVNLANMVHFNNGGQFQDVVGGFQLRNKTGALSGITVGQVTNGLSNPGEGTRFNVVRYETPTVAGFLGSAAWGEDDLWDVALRYAGEFSGIKLAAGIGYAQWTDGNGVGSPASTSPERGCSRTATTSDSKCAELGLSASIMHLQTGLFVTGAYGHRNDENRSRAVPGTRERDEFYWIAGGVEQKFTPLGKSTFYGEYLQGYYGAAINSTGAAPGVSVARSAAPLGLTGNIASTDISVWGLGFNQNVEAATLDLYVAYRNFSFDVTSTTGRKSQLEDLQTVQLGARIQF